MLSFIISGSGTINAVANGRQYVIPRTHRNYDRAKQALRTGDADTFVRAVDYQQTIQQFVPAGRKVEIRGDHVYLNGTPLHNVVTERILALARDGWPWEPVGNFLDNIQQNPSYRAIQELYTFLEHRALPITENGHFLAYKAVRADWKDKHSGTFDNGVGQTVRMPRNTVNDDAREGCSNGLHVGSIEYVNGFKNTDDHVVICRVNPRDVVSVPFDANCTKLRCCEYTVIGEYAGDLTGLVYTSEGTAVPPPGRNDPAQAVTQAPPPRDGERWAGLDPGAPEGDKSVPFDFTADDVGLGPKEEDDQDEIEADYDDDDFDGSDLEDDFDSELDDDSSLDPDDTDDYEQEPVNQEDDIPEAEPVTDDAQATDIAYRSPYNLNAEYGGES